MNLFPVRISFAHSRERSQLRGRLRPSRISVIAVGALGLVATLMAVPASAATSGSNSATVNLAPSAPPPVRSITVSPTTAAFGECVTSNGTASSSPSELPFPNGGCNVGDPTNTGVVGGITITNGNTAGHIDINGQPATPADAGGTPWTIAPTSAANPGVDQFFEFGFGSHFLTNNNNNSDVGTAPTCDTAFNVVGTAGDCSASAGQASNEALFIEGPSSSTDQNGPFTITTTWTAVP
jgi:hypothetical protein